MVSETAVVPLYHAGYLYLPLSRRLRSTASSTSLSDTGMTFTIIKVLRSTKVKVVVVTFNMSAWKILNMYQHSMDWYILKYSCKQLYMYRTFLFLFFMLLTYLSQLVFYLLL